MLLVASHDFFFGGTDEHTTSRYHDSLCWMNLMSFSRTSEIYHAIVYDMDVAIDSIPSGYRVSNNYY